MISYPHESAVIAGAGELILVGVDGLLRTTDGGTTWVRGGVGLDSVMESFVVRPGTSRGVYYGFGGGCLYQSHDDGASWSVVTCDGAMVSGILAVDEPGRVVYLRGYGTYVADVCGMTGTGGAAARP